MRTRAGRRRVKNKTEGSTPKTTSKTHGATSLDREYAPVGRDRLTHRTSMPMSVAHIRFGRKKQVSFFLPEVRSLKKLPDINLELDSWKGVESGKDETRKSRARLFILEPPNTGVGTLQKSNLRGSRHRGGLLDNTNGKVGGL